MPYYKTHGHVYVHVLYVHNNNVCVCMHVCSVCSVFLWYKVMCENSHWALEMNISHSE